MRREERTARDAREIEDLSAGGFEVDGFLAQGGSARLYRGRGPEGPVALKLLPTKVPESRLEIVRRIAAIGHPALVRILGVGSQASGSWMAMELLEGPSLEEILAGGPLPLDRALGLAGRIAKGLGALHRAGFVHRDLKPSNVIVLPDDRLKIVDFGLALPVGTPPAEAGFEGSWGYAAPEQLMGRAADPRSDVYALGVVLYRMLLGRLPYGDAPVAAALGHLHDRPPPPRAVDPSIPAEVEALVLRALAKDPRDRFASMEAFAAEIEACKGAGRAAARTPPRRGWISALGVLAALALVATQILC